LRLRLREQHPKKRDALILKTQKEKNLQKPGITPISPTDYATDPQKGPESGPHGPLWREAASGGRLLDGDTGACGFSFAQDPKAQA
jgi:hypothetical protein